jgi:broad specificity polyphosphatase/5'/3'-nucleotidase SurE
MKILLTNDDGIFAPGLAAIYKEPVERNKPNLVRRRRTSSSFKNE